MPRRRRRDLVLALGVTIVVMLSPCASAHERKVVGPYRLTIGWGEEPAFTGARNSVSVAVSDASGAPVTDPGGSLAVEVSFGNERITLALQPAWQRPGEFQAWLVPTRSGTYSFHVTGTLKGHAIDTTSTCSDKTFHCVADVSEVQFPAKDPSVAQLTERVNRALPRAERAIDTAAAAQKAAIAALTVAALALAATLAGRRRRSGKVD
jgi:hypothetical protein